MIRSVIVIVIGLALMSAEGFAQAKPKPQPFNTFFTAQKKWLALPVKNGASKRKVDLWIDGKNPRSIDIELAEDTVDWMSYLDISQWSGKEIDLRVNELTPGAKTFAPVIQTDEDRNEGVVYKEPMRGQFHFSPKRGWTNDPNGMVYYNGEYHLFFQHNPYGREWGNMHWGHAVSKDLVHWSEVGEALYPDESGTMFSGSGIVDVNNTSGLGRNGKAPMVLFYTADHSWTQGLAWSTDGRTFEKTPTTVIPRFSMGNRDPKVIWHEPSKKWVLVFYAESREKPYVHTMRFYTSTNLKDWAFASSIIGGKPGNAYLFECPEFYEIAVEGTNEKKWILTAANGEYSIGSFDGQKFTPEVERLRGNFGRDYYAPQTFNNEPKGRRVEIGWWRTYTNKGSNTFNQSQSVPLHITLIKTDSGLRLSRLPVPELQTLRSNTFNIGKTDLKEGGANPFAKVDAAELEMRLDLVPGTAKEITLTIHGKTITYNAAKQVLICDGVEAPALLSKGKLSLIILADRIGFEIFSADGTLFMPVNVNLNMNQKEISISATGGKAKLEKATVYALKSIWE
jgi:fructan beta-fructosidase